MDFVFRHGSFGVYLQIGPTRGLRAFAGFEYQLPCFETRRTVALALTYVNRVFMESPRVEFTHQEGLPRGMAIASRTYTFADIADFTAFKKISCNQPRNTFSKIVNDSPIDTPMLVSLNKLGRSRLCESFDEESISSWSLGMV